eukprot:3555526-Rhodomonas_salina.1
MVMVMECSRASSKRASSSQSGLLWIAASQPGCALSIAAFCSSSRISATFLTSCCAASSASTSA